MEEVKVKVEEIRAKKKQQKLKAIPEEKPKEKDHGIHVLLQRGQVLLRPAQLRGHPSQGHPRQVKAAEADRHLLRVLPGRDRHSLVHGCRPARPGLPSGRLDRPVRPTR